MINYAAIHIHLDKVLLVSALEALSIENIDKLTNEIITVNGCTEVRVEKLKDAKELSIIVSAYTKAEMVFIEYYTFNDYYSFFYFNDGEQVRTICWNSDIGHLQLDGKEQDFEEGYFTIKYLQKYPIYNFDPTVYSRFLNNLGFQVNEF